MALIVADCPHCGTAKSGMPIFGVRAWPEQFPVEAGLDEARNRHYVWEHSVSAVCQQCYHPICALLGGGPQCRLWDYASFVTKSAIQLLGEGNIEVFNFKLVEIWPKAPEPTIPAHVPPSVERAMLQAEKNFPIAGSEEASAMMYRRSLELTLADLYPAQKGTLAKRIKDLVEKHTLPEAMGQWADEIRQLGNDAAHDPDDVDRPQLTMIRGFTDATLRYLYTLPAEVAARRKLQSDAE